MNKYTFSKVSITSPPLLFLHMYDTTKKCGILYTSRNSQDRVTGSVYIGDNYLH